MTSDFNKEKRSKHDLRVIVLGSIDELNSAVGLVRALLPKFQSNSTELNRNLKEVQETLFRINSEIARSAADSTLIRGRTEQLEQIIDHYTAKLPELNNFCFPAGTPAAAAAHVARTTCRRAERLLVALSQESVVPGEHLKFMNRLSDFLFTIARRINQIEGHAEEIWRLDQQSST